MATIEESFFSVLQQDSRDRLEQAGLMWREAFLSFYYPGNEPKVDEAIIAVVRSQLQRGSTLPDHVWLNLRAMINGTTRVKEAIPVVGSALGAAILG